MNEKGKKKNRPGDKIKLKEVHKAWGAAEAEVIKSFLENNGISCIFRGQVVQSVHPFSVDGLGEIKIFVSDRDYSTAKKLLNQKKNP